MCVSGPKLSGVGLVVQDLETLRKLLPFLTKGQASNGNGSNGHNATSNGSAHQASIPPLAPSPPPGFNLACCSAHPPPPAPPPPPHFFALKPGAQSECPLGNQNPFVHPSSPLSACILLLWYSMHMQAKGYSFLTFLIRRAHALL